MSSFQWNTWDVEIWKVYIMKHKIELVRGNTYMRHSTLVPWLQKGQLKTVSSLSIRFLGAGFALDFLFPMVQVASLKADYNHQTRIATLKSSQLYDE